MHDQPLFAKTTRPRLRAWADSRWRWVARALCPRRTCVAGTRMPAPGCRAPHRADPIAAGSWWHTIHVFAVHETMQIAFSSQEECQRFSKMTGFSPSARQAMAYRSLAMISFNGVCIKREAIALTKGFRRTG